MAPEPEAVPELASGRAVPSGSEAALDTLLRTLYDLGEAGAAHVGGMRGAAGCAVSPGSLAAGRSLSVRWLTLPRHPFQGLFPTS
jgi:hypothetical protein